VPLNAFRSPEAQAALRAWVPRFLAKLGDVPTEARTVATRFGDTHLLVAGPADGPPLVVLHGAMASAAHVLNEVKPLLSRYRVYAPDVLGHSPMSADARPPIDGYGAWGTDVLDALGLDRVALCGVSYGGFVALRLLATAPERVSRVSLVVPGGLVSGSAWVGLTRVGLPLLLYRWWPTEARLRAFLEPQFTTWDDDWAHWLGDAVRNFRMDFRVPPLARPEELAGFRGPAQVFGADDDVHFPGPPLLVRAKEVLPNVVDTELLEDCRHAPPFDDSFRERLCGRIAGFLEG
jgi:2-hydroxy-6-oxonona-2,4-dienedioate hydrolase